MYTLELDTPLIDFFVSCTMKKIELTQNCLNVTAVLNVDNSIVDLETIEALYENVSVENKLQFMNLCIFLRWNFINIKCKCYFEALCCSWAKYCCLFLCCVLFYREPPVMSWG